MMLDPLEATTRGRAASPSPVKDRQTVDAEGRSVAPRIHGVEVRPLTTIPDDRGTVCVLFNPAWGVHPAPLVYVYQVTIRPGVVKGWVRHERQDDRSAVVSGTIKVVLYDGRPGSPTRGMVNELCFGDHHRALFTSPAGVWHAKKNVGTTDAVFVNMPTRGYDHADPDKYRLPLENDVIPYRWR